MSTISGFIVLIVVTCLMSAASRHFGERFRLRMTQSLTYGIVCGLVCALAPKVYPVIAMIFLLCILALMIYICFWWKINGSTWKELIIVSLLDLMVMLTGQSAAARILDITSVRFIVGFVKVLPVMGFILSVGFFIANKICFTEWLNSEEFDPSKYNVYDGDEEEEDEDESTLFEKVRRWVYEKDSTYDYLRCAGDRCSDR